MDAADVVRVFWRDVWTDGRVELVHDIIDPDMRENGEPAPPQSWVEGITRWRETFTGFRADIEELLTVGDRVVTRVAYSGNHAKPWAGLPASGRSFSSIGIDIFTISGGRIVELWHATDHLDLAMQIGARLTADG